MSVKLCKAIAKRGAICPNGHKSPIVQYLAKDGVYCCTKCATTWKARYELTVPEGFSGEQFMLLVEAAPDLLSAHKQIIALASGWDESGALGPKEPLSWESVARLAMDIAQAAKAKAEGRYEQHVAAIAKAEGRVL